MMIQGLKLEATAFKEQSHRDDNRRRTSILNRDDVRRA